MGIILFEYVSVNLINSLLFSFMCIISFAFSLHAVSKMSYVIFADCLVYFSFRLLNFPVTLVTSIFQISVSLSRPVQLYYIFILADT